METTKEPSAPYTASTNACKVCTPLGASVVFKGIEGCLPMLHGSQGCATYIRRYLISHFKEPMDIASSNFSEATTVFGGYKNFVSGIKNIINQYNPKVIAIASTCLSETIGEDVPAMIKEFKNLHKDEVLPEFVYASTPSYNGTHADGFHDAVLATVKALATEAPCNGKVNIFSGFVSTEDIRNIKEIMEDFGLGYNLFPDYSDSLDNPAWGEFKKIPEGGTSIQSLKDTGSAIATIEFGHILNSGGINSRIKTTKTRETAGEYLQDRFSIPNYRIGMPVGIKETDALFELLSQISKKPIPEKYTRQRGRLIDAYIDAHKHVFGQRAVVYGEEDMLIGIVSLLNEIGIVPILIASGGESGKLKEILETKIGFKNEECIIKEGADFEDIRILAKDLNPDLFIGNSKAYYIAREFGKPLVRVGFPVHDRYGGQHIKHLLYEGAQSLFDTIANTIVQYKQDKSEVGYKYY